MKIQNHAGELPAGVKLPSSCTVAEERKIKMDERAKQKEARQIEKERKAMEREEKVKKKDKQKKEKQRAIKKPTGRKEILNLGDKDNTQCSFCEVFYQDDVTGDSWVCCDMQSWESYFTKLIYYILLFTFVEINSL